LGMLDAMRALNQHLERERSVRLAIRVGIHTGLWKRGAESCRRAGGDAG
jgi:hypothetical protein